MAWYWWTGSGVLGLIVVIVWIVALVDLIRRRKTYSRAQVFAWLILIVILPLLGAVGYFLVNGTGSGGHELEVADVDKLPPGGRMF